MDLLIKLYNATSYFRQFVILLCLSVGLSACNGTENPIEADDFGFPKFSISASGLNVIGKEGNQLSQWSNTGYKYNGDLAVIMVSNNLGNYYSLWSSWAGNNEGTLSVEMQGGPNCCIGGTSDAYGNCSNEQYCANPDAQFETIDNAPCVFSKGQGLYILVTTNPDTSPPPSITDPNAFANVNRMPSVANFFTAGLWQYTGMYQSDTLASGYIGYISNAISGNGTTTSYQTSSATSIPGATAPGDNTYVNGDVYFKILDRYYDDNSGFFNVVLKRGFESAVTPPITRILDIVTANLNATSQNLFININNNPEILSIVRLLLFIFIIVNGSLYVSGISKMSQKELLDLGIKLVIVIQLLTTETSWSVFNNYFFSFFTNGLGEILEIITSSISGFSGGFAWFDNILSLLTSRETSIKILALLISIPSGIVVVVMLYLTFLIFAISIAKGVILYLLALLATSLLVALGPVFITFLLFKSSRSLFEGWVNQFAVYFFQPLLAFAALTLMAQVIINAMYKILGFRACYEAWFSIGSFVVTSAWQMCVNSSSDILTTIPVPGYTFVNATPGDSSTSSFCTPYTCDALRYVDLPFLDTVSDASLINAFFNNPYVNLNLPMLYNGFILLLTTFVIFLFMDTLPQLASGIAGGGATASNLGAATSAAFNSITSGATRAFSGVKELAMTKTQAGRALRGKIESFKEDVARLTAPIPDQNKLPGLRTFGNIASAAFNVGHLAFRTVIPAGSLRGSKEAQREFTEREDYKPTVYGSAMKNVIGEVSGYNSVMRGAEAFDEKVKNIKHGLADTVHEFFKDKRPQIVKAAAKMYNERMDKLTNAKLKEAGAEPIAPAKQRLSEAVNEFFGIKAEHHKKSPETQQAAAVKPASVPSVQAPTSVNKEAPKTDAQAPKAPAQAPKTDAQAPKTDAQAPKASAQASPPPAAQVPDAVQHGALMKEMQMKHKENELKKAEAAAKELEVKKAAEQEQKRKAVAEALKSGGAELKTKLKDTKEATKTERIENATKDTGMSSQESLAKQRQKADVMASIKQAGQAKDKLQQTGVDGRQASVGAAEDREAGKTSSYNKEKTVSDIAKDSGGGIADVENKSKLMAELKTTHKEKVKIEKIAKGLGVESEEQIKQRKVMKEISARGESIKATLKTTAVDARNESQEVVITAEAPKKPVDPKLAHQALMQEMKDRQLAADRSVMAIDHSGNATEFKPSTMKTAGITQDKITSIHKEAKLSSLDNIEKNRAEVSTAVAQKRNLMADLQANGGTAKANLKKTEVDGRTESQERAKANKVQNPIVAGIENREVTLKRTNTDGRAASQERAKKVEKAETEFQSTQGKMTTTDKVTQDVEIQVRKATITDAGSSMPVVKGNVVQEPDSTTKPANSSTEKPKPS